MVSSVLKNEFRNWLIGCLTQSDWFVTGVREREEHQQATNEHRRTSTDERAPTNEHHTGHAGDATPNDKRTGSVVNERQSGHGTTQHSTIITQHNQLVTLEIALSREQRRNDPNPLTP